MEMLINYMQFCAIYACIYKYSCILLQCMHACTGYMHVQWIRGEVAISNNYYAGIILKDLLFQHYVSIFKQIYNQEKLANIQVS